ASGPPRRFCDTSPFRLDFGAVWRHGSAIMKMTRERVLLACLLGGTFLFACSERSYTKPPLAAGSGGSSASGGSTPTGPEACELTSAAPGGAAGMGGGSEPGAQTAGTPVASLGHLRVDGAKLVSECGGTVQLKGVSSMWLNWENDGYALSL